MPFTEQNVSQMAAQLKHAAGALLMPQDVDLRGAGRVQVRLHVSTRRASEADLTGGAGQTGGLVATVDADDWAAHVARPPQKGDVIWWTGLRHAVVEAHLAAPAGQPAFWKVDLKG